MDDSIDVVFGTKNGVKNLVLTGLSRSSFVPGDPNECRMHARECLRLAESASKEAARETFSKLANTWLSLAAELERNQALLETWGVNSDTRPTASRNPPEVAPRG